jgi:cytoskeletal protein CcmA (bactofilin family)
MHKKTVRISTGALFLFFITMLPATFTGGRAFALEARTGETILVVGSETVTGDLYVSGATAVIEGTVKGDLWSACGSLEVRGHVEGSVFAVGGTILLSGDVGGGIKAIGGTLTAANRIETDLFFLGNKLDIRNTASVGGDLYFVARESFIEGPIEGFLKGGGKMISIGDKIGKDAVLYIQYLTLTEGARINGDLTYTSGEEAILSPFAAVDGKLTRHVPEYRRRAREIVPFLMLAGVSVKAFRFVTLLLVGLVLILAAPKIALLLSEGIRRKPGASAGWGAVLLFGIPLAIAVASATLVGIGIGALTAFAFFIALCLGQVSIGLCVGRLILGIPPDSERKGVLFGGFALGLFIIALLRFIPVFGWLVWAASSLFGLGSFVTAAILKKRE